MAETSVWVCTLKKRCATHILVQITGQSGQHGQSVKGQVHNIVFVTVKYYFQWVSSVRRTAVRAEPALIPISFQKYTLLSPVQQRDDVVNSTCSI